MARRMPARTQCEESPQRQPSFSDNDVESELKSVCAHVIAGRCLNWRKCSSRLAQPVWRVTPGYRQDAICRYTDYGNGVLRGVLAPRIS